MVISCACLGSRHSPHSNYLCSSVGPRFKPFTSPTRSWCATCWTTIKIVFSIFWDGGFVGSSPPPSLYQSLWVVGAKPPDVDISTTCLTKIDHSYYCIWFIWFIAASFSPFWDTFIFWQRSYSMTRVLIYVVHNWLSYRYLYCLLFKKSCLFSRDIFQSVIILILLC